MTYSANVRVAMQEIAQKNPDWIQLGLFIIKIGKSKAWKQMSPNFKEWLDDFAKHLDVTRASLFKYRAGVEIGLGLQGLSASDDEMHIIEALSKTKSDIIETLAKIIPLVPKDVARKLTDDVFSGTASRAELRVMLQLYKQSMDGKEENSPASENAAMLATLVSTGTAWLPDSRNITAHKLVANLQYVSLDDCAVTFDAVLAVKRRVKDCLSIEIHGLTIAREKSQLTHMKQKLSHCDYQWILFTDAVTWDATVLPGVGMLQVQQETASRVRDAVRLGQRQDVALMAHALLSAVL